MVQPASHDVAQASTFLSVGTAAVDRVRVRGPWLADEMHGHQPSAEPVAEAVQAVSIRDSVDGGIKRNGKEKDVCHKTHAHATGHAGHHVARTERFDEQDIRHDAGDVVVRGEWGEPVDGEIVDPYDEDGNVDWEDPQHQDDQRMRVVVERGRRGTPRFPGETQGAHARRELHDAEDHVGELVGDHRGDHEKEDAGRDDALERRRDCDRSGSSSISSVSVSLAP